MRVRKAERRKKCSYERIGGIKEIETNGMTPVLTLVNLRYRIPRRNCCTNNIETERN